MLKTTVKASFLAKIMMLYFQLGGTLNKKYKELRVFLSQKTCGDLNEMKDEKATIFLHAHTSFSTYDLECI